MKWDLVEIVMLLGSKEQNILFSRITIHVIEVSLEVRVIFTGGCVLFIPTTAAIFGVCTATAAAAITLRTTRVALPPASVHNQYNLINQAAVRQPASIAK